MSVRTQVLATNVFYVRYGVKSMIERHLITGTKREIRRKKWNKTYVDGPNTWVAEMAPVPFLLYISCGHVVRDFETITGPCALVKNFA